MFEGVINTIVSWLKRGDKSVCSKQMPDLINASFPPSVSTPETQVIELTEKVIPSTDVHLPILRAAGVKEIDLRGIPTYVEFLTYLSLKSEPISSVEEFLGCSSIDKLENFRQELDSLMAIGRVCSNYSEASWVALYSIDSYRQLFKLLGCSEVVNPIDFTVKLLVATNVYLKNLDVPQFSFVPKVVLGKSLTSLQNEINNNSSIRTFLESSETEKLEVSKEAIRSILSELEILKNEFSHENLRKVRWKIHPNDLNSWFRELGVKTKIHPIDCLTRLYRELYLTNYNRTPDIEIANLDQEMTEHRNLARNVYSIVFSEQISSFAHAKGVGVRAFSGEVATDESSSPQGTK